LAHTKKSNSQLFFNGLLSENPIFRLALSMCPAVGISTSVMNGILLGVAVLFVQVFRVARFRPSRTTSIPNPDPHIHLDHCHLGDRDRSRACRLCAGSLQGDGDFRKTHCCLCHHHHAPGDVRSQEPSDSLFLDAVGMGLGFLFGMVTLGAIREILGSGTFLGFDLVGENRYFSSFSLRQGSSLLDS